MKSLGMNRATECSDPPNMPSSNILFSHAIISVGNVIYSFGGTVGSFHGTDEAFKYDLTTNTWGSISRLLQQRYWCNVIQLCEYEIFITGIFWLLFKLAGIPGATSWPNFQSP